MLTIGKQPIKFSLKKEFKENIKKQKVNWGYEGLSEFTFYRTYSRKKDDGTLETWADCVIRVIEGMFSILKTHTITSHLPWDEKKAHKSAEEAAERLFEFKWTPPGRGLWMMGTDYLWERGATALYNCSFVSTENIDVDLSKPFAFIMDVMMQGVGSGYDTDGAGKLIINKPTGVPEVITVDDTREGWVELISCLLDSYFEEGSAPVEHDTSLVRKYGEDIRGFGGTASGPEPLIQGFNGIRDILNKRDGELITSTDIVSIMGIIGKIVVAGNVRRCLPEGARIQTSEGMKTIKNIVAGDSIITGGKTHTVLEQVYSGEQDTLTIKHSCGKLECTPLHKVAVFNALGSYSFKSAKDICINDRLVWDGLGYEGELQTLPIFTEELHFNAKSFHIPKTINTEVSWLFGLIHGDGYVGTKDIEISAATHEINNLEHANNIFIKHFGISGKISKIKGKNCYRLRLHSAGLARWLLQHLKKPRLSIVIPEYIMNAKKEIRYAYLAGVFDSDGRGRKDGVIEQVTTIYPSFRDDIISLLSSLGIGSAVYHVKRHGKDNRKDAFSVKIVGNTNRKKWATAVSKYIITDKLVYSGTGSSSPFDFSYPVAWFDNRPKGYKIDGNVLLSSNLFQCTDYFPTKVTEILHNKSKPTYDIEVNTVQQFTTDGLVVHNSALLALGSPTDNEYVTLKNWDKNPVEMGIKAPEELEEVNKEEYDIYNDINTSFEDKGVIAKKYAKELWSYKFNGFLWASNNSLYATSGMDYKPFVDSISQNGEPGFFWLETARSYGRLKDGIKNDDLDVKGLNPCAEIQLTSYETCNLNENYPANHSDYWDFQRTLKFSYLYSKAVTLLATNWQETNSAINKNRRIGCSISGIQEAFIKFGRKEFLDWLDQAYSYLDYLDKKYSDWLGIPKSIRKTTVKPSGSVSLLAGTLPGIHHTESTSYFRLVRIANTSPIIPILKAANYKIEPAASDLTRTSVVYFPIVVDSKLPEKANVSIWRQFKDLASLQNVWADNAVSITVTFTKEEVNQIEHCLSAFDSEIKSVSLLPLSEHGYVQAPYTAAPLNEVQDYAATLLPLDFSVLTTEAENAESNKFCSNDSCEI